MAKSRRGKSGSSTEVVKWESELSEAIFSEGTWRPRVIFFVPHTKTDGCDLKLLHAAVSGGTRKLFSSVNKELLLNEVKEILQIKQAKGKQTVKVPAFSEVCEAVKHTIDAGEQLSTKLSSQLLKFKLLALKQKDLDRREEEKKAEAAILKQKSQDERSRSKGSDSAGKRSKSHSPGKAKKGKKEETSPKKDTKLKKRGEMVDHIVTIDDEPQGPDAPDHYILLFGFHDVNLIKALDNMHVSTNSIIKFDNTNSEKSNVEDHEHVDVDILDTTSFWDEYNDVFAHANSDHPIKNIGKFQLDFETQNDSSANEAEMSVLMFDKLAKCCYEMLRQEKNYHCYLENLKLIDVADDLHPDKALQASNTSLGQDDNIQNKPKLEIRKYEMLMAELPPESQSISYQMNCLLEQVVETTEKEKYVEEIVDKEHVNKTGNNNDLHQYFDDVLSKLGLEENIIDSSSPKNHSNEHLQVLNSFDKRLFRLFPLLKSENHKDVIRKENNVLLLHRSNCLLNRKEIVKDPVITANFRQIQQMALNDECNKFSIAQFNHDLALSSFECMSNECCNNNTRSQWLSYYDATIPFDYPFKVSRQSCCTLNLSQWCYSQLIEAEAVPQIIADNADEYDFVDSRYHHALGCTLLIFHNSNLRSNEREITWKDWLHSDVGYQNYLEYVAPYVKQWTNELQRQDEEAERIEQSISQERSPTPEVVSIKDTNSNKLLTRAEMAAQKTVEEDKGGKKKGKKSGRTRSNSPTKGKSPEKSALKSPNKRAPSSKSNAGSRGGSASKKSSRVRIQPQPDENDTGNRDETVNEIETRHYLFTGYSLGDKLCHLNGSQWSYQTNNGGRINVIKNLAVQNNELVDISYHDSGNKISLAIKNPICEISKLKEETSAEQIEVNAPQLDQEITEDDENNNNLFPPLDQYLPQKSSDLFSVNVQFYNGIRFSYSSTPSQDELLRIHQLYNVTFKEYNNMNSAPHASSSGQHIKGGSPKGRKKHEEEAKRLEEIERQIETDKLRLIDQAKEHIKDLKKIKTQTQDLYFSCPNGLQLAFQNRFNGDFDDNEDEMNVTTLKQWYSGYQSRESVRIYTMNGDVIQFVSDEKSLVLRADGSVYFQLADTTHKELNQDIDVIQQWNVTAPDGRVALCENDKEDLSSVNHLSTVHSTDLETGTILTTREDGVRISRQLDGTQIVDHLDGTRITTQTIPIDDVDTETGEKRSQQIKKIITIDCPGYALVTIDYSTNDFMFTFGEGSKVTRHKDGQYEIKSLQDSHITINKEGRLVYSHSHNQEGLNLTAGDMVTNSSSCSIDPSQPTECFKMTDKDQSLISVSHQGMHLVDNSQKQNESSSCDEPFNIKYFLVYADGTAEELLHKNAVEHVLNDAKSDTSVAVMESNIDDNPSAKCFTIIRPIKAQEWGTPHGRENIIPDSLMDKDLSSFEMQFESNSSNSNRFGASLGRGLNIGVPSKIPSSIPPKPTRLSIEQYIQHNPLTDERREIINNCFQKYNTYVVSKSKQREEYNPVEPRNEEEKEAAQRLIDGYFVDQQTNGTRSDLGQGMTSEGVLSSYMSCLHPIEPPPPAKIKPCLTAEQWEVRHLEHAEAKYAAMEINAGLVPAYFDTEEGQDFLRSQSNKFNIDELAGKLAKSTTNPQHKENSSSPHRLSSGNLSTDNSCDGSLTDFLPPMTSSESTVNNQKILKDISHQSFGRPGNPTPLQATKKLESNLTLNATDSRFDKGSSSMTHSNESKRKTYSSTIESKMPLSPSKDTRLHHPPNTVSVSGSVNPSMTLKLQGFTMMPIEVDFGYLKEGMTYRCTVALKNLGISSSRFKIIQPPPSTGMRVFYTPGPIAAGMLIYFDVEIFAIAVGVKGSSGIGSVSHHIEVVTEIETYLLPVHAYVLTQRTDLDGQHFIPGTGIRMMNTQSTIKESINRPRSREQR